MTSVAVANLELDVEYVIKKNISEAIIKMHKIVEEEANRVLAEDGYKINVRLIQKEEMRDHFLRIYKERREKLEKDREMLKKAIDNVEQSQALEDQYLKEFAEKKDDALKKKQETDEVFLNCQKME